MPNAETERTAHDAAIMRCSTDDFVSELRMMGVVTLMTLNDDQLRTLLCKHVEALAKERSNLLHFFSPPTSDEIVKVDYHLVAFPHSTIGWLNRVTTKLGNTAEVVKGPIVNPETAKPWLDMLNQHVAFHRTGGIYADEKNGDEVSPDSAPSGTAT